MSSKTARDVYSGHIPAGGGAVSKLAWHFQGMDNEVAALVNSEWVKAINPSEQNPYPRCKVIARFVFPDDDGYSNEMVHKGADGARKYVARLKPEMALRPWLHAVESPNEPLAGDLFSKKWREVLADFLVEFLRLGHGLGWRMVVGNFSVGQPPLEGWAQFQRFIRAMGPGDLLGLHEYAKPEMWDGDGWLTLRYRLVLRKLDELKCLRPRIIINECGLDSLIYSGPVGGWQYFGLSHREYFEQLRWYDDELTKDPEVVAATPFTAAPAEQWETYRIDVELSRLIHDRIAGGIVCVPEMPQEDSMGTLNVKVEYQVSPVRLIAGDVGKKNVGLILTDAWGNGQSGMSGGKPEWGVGGFEFVAGPGTYTLIAEGRSAQFAHKAGITKLKVTLEAAPEPMPELTPEPSPDMYAAIMEKLDRILALLAEL